MTDPNDDAKLRMRDYYCMFGEEVNTCIDNAPACSEFNNEADCNNSDDAKGCAWDGSRCERVTAYSTVDCTIKPTVENFSKQIDIYKPPRQYVDAARCDPSQCKQIDGRNPGIPIVDPLSCPGCPQVWNEDLRRCSFVVPPKAAEVQSGTTLPQTLVSTTSKMPSTVYSDATISSQRANMKKAADK